MSFIFTENINGYKYNSIILLSDQNMEPYIPYEISGLALKYSIPLLFIGGLVSIIYNQRIMGLLQFVVYSTSIVFWSHIGRDKFIRYIDMSCSAVLLLWVTYVSTYLIPNTRHIWYPCLGISISVFLINQAVFAIGIEFCKEEGWRTYMTYQSVIIHMIFLHILPVFTGIYCVIVGRHFHKIK